MKSKKLVWKILIMVLLTLAVVMAYSIVTALIAGAFAR
jgi:uncharacterized protein YpmS